MIEQHLRDNLRGFSATRILDVGPGYNNFSRIAAEVTGAQELAYMDYDEDILTWQVKRSKREHYAAQAIRITLGVDELAALPGEYDLILCQEVFEHLTDAEEVLKALVKHLSQKGRIVVTVPTRCSERWLKLLNPSYMKDEPYGHVREFDERGLRCFLQQANLKLLVFLPTQPHYFVAHTWLFGSRMHVEGSSGRILTGGVRGFIFGIIHKYTGKLFSLAPLWWGKLLPRNYFVIAEKADRAAIP